MRARLVASQRPQVERVAVPETLAFQAHITSVSSIAAVICAIVVAQPAVAQTDLAEDKSAAICLMIEHPAEIDASAVRTGIVVPTTDVAAMIDRGFRVTPCQQLFTDTTAQIEWRDQVCAMAANQPEGIQLQLERLLGERPAVLCGMAEMVLGPWVGSAD